MKFPKTRRFRNGSIFASLEANKKGYSITYSKNGRVIDHQTFYLSDGYNRNVGRIEALRQLKREHFIDITK